MHTINIKKHEGHTALRWLGACNSIERGIVAGLLRAAKLPDVVTPSSDPAPSEVAEMKELHRSDALATHPIEFIEALMSSFQRQRVRLLQGVDTTPIPSDSLPVSPGFLLAGRNFFHPAVFQELEGDIVEEQDRVAGTISVSVGVLRNVGMKPVPSNRSQMALSDALRGLGARFTWPDEEGLHKAAHDDIESHHHRGRAGAGHKGESEDGGSEDGDGEEGLCLRSQLPSYAWNIGNKRGRDKEAAAEHVELAPVILDVAVEGPRVRKGKGGTKFEIGAGVLSVFQAQCNPGCTPASNTATLKREVVLDTGNLLTFE